MFVRFAAPSVRGHMLRLRAGLCMLRRHMLLRMRLRGVRLRGVCRCYRVLRHRVL
jgi:hypothetical protein